MIKLILLFFVCLFFQSNAAAQLEVPPHWNYKKIRTAHFDIIYNTEQQDLGLLYAEKLERAHNILAHYFSAIPEKTVVIINDKTDVSNGYATRIPYPHIMAYPAIPGPEESLADTGDWAFELLAHEYTHILTFEPATGFMKVLRGVFGNVLAPNILLPNWWKEGLAVQMETRLSSHGRLRSVYQDSVIRALVKDNRLLEYSLAEANENIPSWPEGKRPYLFGSLMWSEMVHEYGDAIVDKLNQKHSRRVPYFVEAPAKEEMSRTYEEEYQRALLDTKNQAAKQIAELEKVTPTIAQEVDFKSMYASAPAISPNGVYLAAITVSSTHSRKIKLLQRQNPSGDFFSAAELKSAEEKQVHLPLAGSIQRLSWFHDSERFIYDKIDATNRIERYSDLYIYNVLTQKTIPLTHGLRAREPAVSPDDQNIAFVKLSGGRTSLALISIKPESTPEILFSPSLQERISYPTFLSEDEIVFSLRKIDGAETLHLFNRKDRSVQELLPDYPNARFSVIDPVKKEIYFTSSKNGTHNIYQFSVTSQQVIPITHTLTAFFNFTRDPLTEAVYATQMTSYGTKIFAIQASEIAKTPRELPQVTALFANRYPDTKFPEPTQPFEYEITDYSTAGYLLPRYWIPFFSTSSAGNGVLLQAMTSAFDPLKKHSYNLSAAWDTGLQAGSFYGTYLNQQTVLPIFLTLSQRSSYLGTLDNKITDNAASLALLPNTFSMSKYSSLHLGWQYFKRTFLNGEFKRTGPYAFAAYEDYSRQGDQISPEEGVGAYLGLYNYIPEKEYIDHSQFKGGGVAYLSKFLPERHALMLRVNGVYTAARIPASFGSQTEAYVLATDTLTPSYLLRGYKVGQLFGRNLLSSNLEYRFPIRNIYRGSGTTPLYLHRLIGAAVVDMASADGFFVNDQDQAYEPVSLKKIYSSYGLELKLETTIGYVIPVSFTLGYYQAPNTPGGGSGSFATNLLIGGL